MTGALALVALTGVAARNARIAARSDPWVPDSFDYAVRMLMRRGAPFDDAMARARAFFAGTAVGNDPRYAHVFSSEEPEWWRLFAPRVIYPAVAAIVADVRGMNALADVARGSYVLYHFALYAFLRRSGSPAAALVATAAIMRQPLIRDLGSIAMTDVPALVPWTIALDAATRIARDGDGWTRFALATAVLSFTRPLPYLPFGAGCGLAVAGFVARDPVRVRRGAAMAGIGAAAAVAVAAVLARAGIPATRDHLERVRAAGMAERRERGDAPSRLDCFAARTGLADDPAHSFARWYCTSVALSAVTSVYAAATEGLPLLALAGFATERGRPELAVYAGVVAGSAAGIISDPVPGGTKRTIVMPLGPIAAAGAVLAFEALRRRIAARPS